MYLVQEMTRPQVERRIKEYPVALFPVGSCEQHGPHLPLGTDNILAEELAKRISQKTGALVFPALNFGYAWVWREVPGTIALDTQTLQLILQQAAQSVQRYGIRLLVFVNGHEANNNSVKYAIRSVQDALEVKLLGMFYPGWQAVYPEVMETPTWGGLFHACEFETSLMLAAKPHLVQMDKAVREVPERPPLYGYDTSSLAGISKSGVYGDPTAASAQKGNRLFDVFVQNAAGLIDEAMQPFSNP